MPIEQPSGVRLEIGHVLFMDIVGYSKRLIDEQTNLIRQLKEIVQGSDQVRAATAEGKLVQLPTGDGMALVFRNTVEAPVLCALEISRALKSHPELRVRLGIHSGPVNEIADVNERANIAGAGINIAQRIMDCGDAGHILLSKHVADDLEHYDKWRPLLHDVGSCEVKHGLRIDVVNLYGDGIGSSRPPIKVVTRRRARLRWVALLAALLLSIIVATAILISRHPTRSAVSEKSIAVLPFENLSRDPDNAYFAAGIQDEILTRLAKIGALKVISRSSTQQYQNKPVDLAEIARQLGVAHILEGSVQKAGNAVHVNVQLIRAATNDHVWAESYDRKLDDIFSVEGEVAGNIATALNTQLTTTEQHLIRQKLTNNSAAYDAYLRGLAMEPRGWYSAEARQAVRAFFAEATQLDPKFASAWARLARIDAWLIFLGQDTSEERRSAVRRELDVANELEPESSDALLARAYYQYWVQRDYSAAKGSFRRLLDALPNSSEALAALSYVARRQGKWEESLTYSQQTLALNPRDVQLLVDRAWTYAVLGRFDEALKTTDRLLQIAPDDQDAIAYQAAFFHSQGKMEEARQRVSRIRPNPRNDGVIGILIQHWLLERDYNRLITTLRPALEDQAISAMSRSLYREAIGYAQLRTGDVESGRARLTQARHDLEALRDRDKNNPEVAAHLGAVYAYLDEKEVALKEGERAVALLPAAKDAVLGPALEEDLARVETTVGEKDRAISRLQKLLVTPYSSVGHGGPVTPALLRLHPYWDPLRADPRFQKLVSEPEHLAHK